MDGTAEAAAKAAAKKWLRCVLRALAAVVLVGLHHSANALDAREFEVGAFHRVYLTGAGTVRITQASVPRLSAHGATSALESLNVETRDGALHIDTSGSGPEVVLYLQVSRLSELVSEGGGHFSGDDLHLQTLRLEGQGAGSFRLHGLEAEELDVEGRGATRFVLTGQVGRQRVQLSGTGAYQAGELISNRISVSIAGASDVRLWADERLDVEVAGTADIRYSGSPRVEQRVSGVASVLRIPQIVI